MPPAILPVFRRNAWLILLGVGWASAGAAQVFEMPPTTWGPLEARGDLGPGLVEGIAALLMIEALVLTFVLVLLGRRIQRQRALRSGVPEIIPGASERVLFLEEKMLRGSTWILAPSLGLAGAIFGHGLTLWGVSVSALLAGGALGILALGAACFVVGSRERLLLGSRGAVPMGAGGRKLW